MSKTYYMRSTNGEVFSTSLPEYHKDCEQLAKAEGERLYREEQRTYLLSRLAPGTTVYTNVTHVSSSGMMRHVRLFVVRDGAIVDITYSAGILTNTKRADDGGLKMSGCGYDVGQGAVYNLGAALWPNGTPEPHGKRNGAPDNAGGYALKQSAL